MDIRPLPLVDDCSSCLGLCCTLLGFTRSADFPTDKAAGVACVNLAHDYSCRIHDSLLETGYRGCVTYSCFGAGPTVTAAAAVASAGDRSVPPDVLASAFGPARQIHELLWYLREAADYDLPSAVGRRLAAVTHRTERAASGALDDLAALQPDDLWREGTQVLDAVSRAVRGPRPGRSLRGADLVGADLHGADLARADLRGARLVAARLMRADLSGADLAGADLRDAQLHGADLSGALFLTSSQLRSAHGSADTVLSHERLRPGTWL